MLDLGEMESAQGQEGRGIARRVAEQARGKGHRIDDAVDKGMDGNRDYGGDSRHPAAIHAFREECVEAVIKYQPAKESAQHEVWRLRTFGKGFRRNVQQAERDEHARRREAHDGREPRTPIAPHRHSDEADRGHKGRDQAEKQRGLHGFKHGKR